MSISCLSSICGQCFVHDISSLREGSRRGLPINSMFLGQWANSDRESFRDEQDHLGHNDFEYLEYFPKEQVRQ